jgi:hypothetical protein
VAPNAASPLPFQVLFSFLWDVTALGDKPGLVSITGSSLVAAGVLFAALTGQQEGGGGPRGVRGGAEGRALGMTRSWSGPRLAEGLRGSRDNLHGGMRE